MCTARVQRLVFLDTLGLLYLGAEIRLASLQGVTVCLEVIVRTGTDGILIPIPQYPLYSATIDLLGGRYVGYYLNEAKGWEMDISELRRALKEAREQGTSVRALAVINPGNPTGQTLSVDNMQAVVKFCEEESLVLMADEVYQANVYGSKQMFTSFRKVVTEMNSKVEVRLIVWPQRAFMCLVLFDRCLEAAYSILV